MATDDLTERLRAAAACEFAEPDTSADDLPMVTWGELRAYGQLFRDALTRIEQDKERITALETAISTHLLDAHSGDRVDDYAHLEGGTHGQSTLALVKALREGAHEQ